VRAKGATGAYRLFIAAAWFRTLFDFVGATICSAASTPKATLRLARRSGIGNANASADLAGLNASTNILSAIGGGLKLGANLAPGLLKFFS